MAKYSGRQAGFGFQPQERALTHEGGLGYVRSARSELFLQAVVEMAEDTYYESAADRQSRLASNVQRVIDEPGGWRWLCDFALWLRNDAQMRSSSIMIAAETVAALQDSKVTPERFTARELVAGVCRRADEPAEMLGYWLTNHGRQIPASVKRGIADAACRLYSERNALKYDGQSRGIRMGDVIELTHPKPGSAEQSALFRHLLDRTHKHDDIPPTGLPLFSKDYILQRMDEDARRLNLTNAVESGWSWERLAGWLPGGMDAEAWEAMIPSMGYMALIRNLRNFDQAGVSAAAIKLVNDKLADPDEVARSRQFPYRFLSAWQATDSLNWASSLERALSLSVNNIPSFEGRTLILVDTSGSMQSPVGGSRSHAQRCDVAALFGTALALRNQGRVDLAIYATGVAPMVVKPGASILRSVQAMQSRLGEVGHGTNTWQAINSQYSGHDRIVVLTDEQSHDSGTNPGCFMHFINLAGYRVATAPRDRKTFAYGGFTDAMFSLLPTMERSVTERWPWQQ